MRKVTTEVIRAGYPFWCLNVFVDNQMIKSVLFKTKKDAIASAKIEKNRLFPKRKTHQDRLIQQNWDYLLKISKG